MPKSTIRGRIVAVFAISLLGVLSTAAIAVAVFTEYSKLTTGLANNTIPELRTAFRLENASHALSASSFELIASENPADIERAYERAKFEVEELERLTSVISVSGKYIDLLSLNRMSQGLRHDLDMIFVIKSKLIQRDAAGDPASDLSLQQKDDLQHRLEQSHGDLFEAVNGVLWHATKYKTQVGDEAETALANVSQRSALGRSSLLTVVGATITIVFLAAWAVAGGLTSRMNTLRDILVGNSNDFPEGYFLPTDEISDMGRAAKAFLADRDALIRTKLEQETLANEFVALINTANAPIFRVDEEGRLEEWNEKAAAITGWAKQEVLGCDFIDMIVAPEARVATFAVIDRAFHGEETASFECKMRSKSGDVLDILLSATARRNSEGHIVGVVGVGQDITEHKNAQMQVVQASKLATLGEMATGVAHELNQPLNVIRIAVANCKRKLSNGAADPEYLMDKLARIDKQVKRAADVIDHMRIFGRKADNEPKPVDVRDAVEGALDLVGAQFRLSQIQVQAEMPQQPAVVLGHQILLEQVFLNILTNARDAIRSSGENNAGEIVVAMSLDEEPGAVTIAFSDTGGGIPEKVLDRIFDPFFTTKDVGQGTGLGLSISYGIIRDMGGKLTASNSEKGGVFTITVPLIVTSDETPEEWENDATTTMAQAASA